MQMLTTLVPEANKKFGSTCLSSEETVAAALTEIPHEMRRMSASNGTTLALVAQRSARLAVNCEFSMGP